MLTRISPQPDSRPHFAALLRGGLQFSLTGGYHVASYTFIGGGEPRTDHYVFVRPGLFYRFTDRLQAGLTYQYRRNRVES